jgi:hypothetical protein
MNKTELLEAERIAAELMTTHEGLVKSGQPGLQPEVMDTFRLARAIHIFQAKAEPEMLSRIARAQHRIEAAL